MIINLKFYKKHGYIKGAFLTLRKMFISLNEPAFRDEKRSFLKKENSYSGYPKFEMDKMTGRFLCTSCELCQQLCPTKCITVEGTRDSRSLFEGSIPKSFLVDLSICTRCNLCIDVCPTDALSANGEYSELEFKQLPLDLKLYEKENFRSES